MAESRLQELSKLGQSVWIDYLSRRLVREGELEELMREHAVVGVTSNPTIFQKAIAEGDAYDEQLREVLAEEEDPKEIFLRLAVKDVQDACDLLRAVWDEGSGKDGYVSIEVDPNLASDTDATIAEAQYSPQLAVDLPTSGLDALHRGYVREAELTGPPVAIGLSPADALREAENLMAARVWTSPLHTP